MNEYAAAAVISVFIAGLFTSLYAIGSITEREEQMSLCVQSMPYVECYKTIME